MISCDLLFGVVREIKVIRLCESNLSDHIVTGENFFESSPVKSNKFAFLSSHSLGRRVV